MGNLGLSTSDRRDGRREIWKYCCLTILKCSIIRRRRWPGCQGLPNRRELKYQVTDVHVAFTFQKDICTQAHESQPTFPRSHVREKDCPAKAPPGFLEKQAAGSRGPAVHAVPRREAAGCFDGSLRPEGTSTVKNKSQGFAASLRSQESFSWRKPLLGILRISSHSTRGENSRGQSDGEAAGKVGRFAG